jgi:hypothetical protein
VYSCACRGQGTNKGGNAQTGFVKHGSQQGKPDVEVVY